MGRLIFTVLALSLTGGVGPDGPTTSHAWVAGATRRGGMRPMPTLRPNLRNRLHTASCPAQAISQICFFHPLETVR